MLDGLQGHLAIEQRELGNHLHAFEQLLRIEGLVVLHRQAFQGPLAVGTLLEADLQAADFQVGNAHLACQQAVP
ncbi:hypothetical protein D3C84_1213100 [compost metagenome]